jgi:hypothetical protein
MKKCSLCAEDIQDAAIVCKHCGRDVKTDASQVQSVEPKKKTSFLTWVVLGFIVISGIGILGSLMSSQATVTAAPTSTAAAPQSPLLPALDKEALEREAVQAAAEFPQDKAELTADVKHLEELVRQRNGVGAAFALKQMDSELAPFLRSSIGNDPALLALKKRVDQQRQPVATLVLAEQNERQHPSSARLQATVSFNGTQFEIENTSSDDWVNVELALNGGWVSSGYVHRMGELKAMHAYKVGAMQFADSSGKRFSPFQLKPQQMTISATLPSGSVGVRIVHFE